MLQLRGVARGDRDAATVRVRDAFSEAGAWITDVRFFSGVQTVIAFDVASDRVTRLREALVRAGLALDDASLAALSGAAGSADGDAPGTLAVVFADGDPDLKRDVPAVPG